MIYPLSQEETINKIREAKSLINDNYFDGFSQWNLKKMLYNIKFELDDALKQTTKFSVEEEWLLEQEKKKMWRELKK